jgi:hypothetical protein
MGLQSSGAVNTAMSSAKDAHAFDPGLNPWERQPGEPDEAYGMYVTYRDMQSRNLAVFDRELYVAREWSARKAQHYSSRWSWGWRNAQFDRYMAKQDVEELIRYRRLMNDRHRRVAAAGFAKFAQWIKDLDVKTLTASEAIRLFDVCVRIEQVAAATHELVDQVPGHPGEPATGPVTLRDLIPGIDPTVEADLARVLDQITHPDDTGPRQERKPWEPPL